MYPDEHLEDLLFFLFLITWNIYFGNSFLSQFCVDGIYIKKNAYLALN